MILSMSHVTNYFLNYRTCNCAPLEIYREKTSDCTPMTEEQREAFLGHDLFRGFNLTEKNFVLANSLERKCPVGHRNDHELRPMVRNLQFFF